ncbi:hypothetical protein YYC_04164 [Plasmodium yoelii 17X]|uniref:Dynein attachment factor-domain containing protein n=3 Tax=Plasmodium yoelii TaxID=5861 RepID=A0AAE9WU64_PLAYO|nr:conserved Plasmodium protein, unknown function [Plasmodium yoelii]ETB58078.1 hypothetical protein YYC_04164 [Plasmodium yoelii 17X]WBY59031.1 dynein attachment factor-domain containing protein [Plasmodium yoelii yoelii]CDU19220.1 conserved Plasmodium protein, unknown function [Plasmodium yoelii]VTZ79855.1 conserved Plasmodium protein, unknown function [Plasmodium yoelii]|eukprot:XP_022812560.1 conserved Plasmodium protein, unknown function [Plasmodium yoelii]
MDVNNYVDSINIKKLRNEFVQSILKDEEYKKKDDKKKDIVKTCKSYKEFCDIVSVINMKPIKKYEEKVTYEDYLNMNISTNNLDNLKKKKNRLKFFSMNYLENNQKADQNYPLLNDNQSIIRKKIKQFLNILDKNKNNYYKFIKFNYNCDEIKDVINFIKNNWNIFFEIDQVDVHNNIINNEQINKKNNFTFSNLIHFFFNLLKYWNEEKLFLYFTHEELKDINSNINIIFQNVKNTKLPSNEDHIINDIECYIKSINL